MREGFRVVPIPGAAAFVAALAASGLPTDAFYFGGFLPARSGQRRRTLESLAELGCVLAFYEAPHRLLETLFDMDVVFGSRTVVVSRAGSTKSHRSVWRLPYQRSDPLCWLASTTLLSGVLTLIHSPASG